jgi:hypothetical protein
MATHPVVSIPLVQRLPDGPLDIIGDVHGELDALVRLIARLGGDAETATVQRPLVFVGDLIDRGPDSPGVVHLVRRLIEAGVAYSVAGNHELNLLRDQRKEGNGWFFGHDDRYLGRPFESVPVPIDDVAPVRSFLASLPLVLERQDLRVVHACYDSFLVEHLPAHGDLGLLAEAADETVDVHLRERGLLQAADEEQSRYGGFIDPEDMPQRPLPATLAVTLAEQAHGPYRVLTSGREEAIPDDMPLFYVGGKWRVVRRARWWSAYHDAPAVVVGHYWRRRGSRGTGRPNLWEAVPPFGWAGPEGNVFCVDYSVGRRFLERWERPEATAAGEYRGGLAALRWPERVLVFDDLEAPVRTTGFGGTPQSHEEMPLVRRESDA